MLEQRTASVNRLCELVVLGPGLFVAENVCIYYYILNVLFVFAVILWRLWHCEELHYE